MVESYVRTEQIRDAKVERSKDSNKIAISRGQKELEITVENTREGRWTYSVICGDFGFSGAPNQFDEDGLLDAIIEVIGEGDSRHGQDQGSHLG
jgi:hypothetical protein